MHSEDWTPPWSSGSVLDRRSLPPVFESRREHIWRVFHLWLRLITFGGRSAHLAYRVAVKHQSSSSSIITLRTVSAVTSNYRLPIWTRTNSRCRQLPGEDISFTSSIYNNPAQSIIGYSYYGREILWVPDWPSKYLVSSREPHSLWPTTFIIKGTVHPQIILLRKAYNKKVPQ